MVNYVHELVRLNMQAVQYINNATRKWKRGFTGGLPFKNWMHEVVSCILK